MALVRYFDAWFVCPVCGGIDGESERLECCDDETLVGLISEREARSFSKEVAEDAE